MPVFFITKLPSPVVEERVRLGVLMDRVGWGVCKWDHAFIAYY